MRCALEQIEPGWPGGRSDRAALPPGCGGRRCLIVLRLRGVRQDTLDAPARLVLDAESGPRGETTITLRRRPSRGARGAAIVFVPTDARSLIVDTFVDAAEAPTLHIIPLRASVAAILLGGARMAALRARLSGTWRGLPKRLRATLAHAAPRAGTDDPQLYRAWTRLFDQWTEADRVRLLGAPGAPSVAALVFAGAGSWGHPLAATVAALRAQWRAPTAINVVSDASAALAAMGEAIADYWLVLQAGEVMPPHAVAMFAAGLASAGRPDVAFADEDRLDADGVRRDPLFKPEASLPLLLSGTATSGAWLVRADRATRHTTAIQASNAEAFRLALWLALHRSWNPPRATRLPFVLSHRAASTVAATPAELGAIVEAHLRADIAEACVGAARLPLRPRLAHATGGGPRVSVVVPTTLANAHVLDCAEAVARTTSAERPEIIYAMSAADRARNETLTGRIEALGARVVLHEGGAFNYSRVNNQAIAAASGEIICLLNDDVAPLAAGWLAILAGWLRLPQIGAVGARLLYPDGSIQHAGILLGVGGVSTHANRFLPRDEPGYGSRALADQAFSAVTGACLMLPRAVHDLVGGLDETLPIAFNDIDLCLRIRQTGREVMLAAEAELVHYESLSLGNHYRGARSGLEADEAEEMRRRWPAAIAADPYHNPNLAREAGREWSAAFPPRVARR